MSSPVALTPLKKLKVRLKRLKPLKKPKVKLTDVARDSQGGIVEVDGCGTFVFPVSFDTFLNSLDEKKVLLHLLEDKEFRLRALKKFYNRFYMFPEKRSGTNFFADEPETSLVQLLAFGRPQDEMATKTVKQHAAQSKKNYQDDINCENLVHFESNAVSNKVTCDMAERRKSTSPYNQINKETTGEQLSQTTMTSSEVDVAKTTTSTSPPIPCQFSSEVAE